VTAPAPEVTRIAVTALLVLAAGNLLNVAVFLTGSPAVVVLWLAAALVSTVWGLFAQARLRKLTNPEGNKP
jgi:hypothetical protein